MKKSQSQKKSKISIKKQSFFDLLYKVVTPKSSSLKNLLQNDENTYLFDNLSFW